jgi:hypothetical protein
MPSILLTRTNAMTIRSTDLPPEIRKQLGASRGRGRNKFNVSTPDRRTFRGRCYDSRAEMLMATRLWGKVDRGDLLEVIEQPKVILAGLGFKIDFLVIPPMGYREIGPCYIEVKGVETQRTRDLLKLWAIHGRLGLIVYKHIGGDKFRETHIIDGGFKCSSPK